MTPRYLVGQQRHDEVVERIASDLRVKGFRDVRAAVPGFDAPAPIGGFQPDVTADDDHLHIFEIETESSLEEEATVRQWRAFAKFANGGGGRFVIIVPTGHGVWTEGRKNYYGIRAEVREADFPKPHRPGE